MGICEIIPEVANVLFAFMQMQNLCIWKPRLGLRLSMNLPST